MKTSTFNGVEYTSYENWELENFARKVVRGELSLDLLYSQILANSASGSPFTHPILKAVTDPLSDVMAIDALVNHIRGFHVDNSFKRGAKYLEYFDGCLDELEKYKLVSLVRIQTLEMVPVYVNRDGSIYTEW